MEKTDEDTRGLAEVIIHTVLFTLTIFLALTGNSLVCLAFYRNRRLRTITNYYVLSMAVADLMIPAFCYPFYVITSAILRWPFNYNLCQFTGSVTQYWVQVSIFILTISAINRYFCVVKPNRYSVVFSKNKTVTSILVVWSYKLVLVFIVTFEIPIIYQWSSYSLYCQPTTLDKRTERIIYVFCGCYYVLPISIVWCFAILEYIALSGITTPPLPLRLRMPTANEQ